MEIYPIIVCLILGFNTLGSSNATEKKRSCATPNLENGYIHRDPPKEESVYYSCNTGYKPLSGKWWEAATCKNGRWSNEPECIQEKKCGVLPSVQHGHLETTAGQSAEIVCDPGFKSLHISIECVNGRWETPTCEVDEQSCDSPKRVENAVIISKPQERYSSGSHVTYKCHRHFTINGNSKVFCRNSAWNKAPTCEAFCSQPLSTVNNSTLMATIDAKKYSHGDTVRYQCYEGYESFKETIAKCDGQTWIYPECIRKSQCTKPTKNLQYVTLLDDKNLFNNFDILRYNCNEPYDKNPEGTLTCRDEKWIGKIDCTSSTCPPPPLIEDGDYTIEYKTDGVITQVSYSCQSYYVLKEPKKHNRYVCRNGIWDNPPKCLKPCKLTAEIYKDYNIQPVKDNYVKHSDREIKLVCKTGWNVGGVRKFDYTTGTCSDGKITVHNKCHTKNWFQGKD